MYIVKNMFTVSQLDTKKNGGKMNYCNGCDIAFEEKTCPLCEAKDTIKEYGKEIDALNEKIANLEGQL
jgi:hypothetical protein